jgi:hypothetical protein
MTALVPLAARPVSTVRRFGEKASWLIIATPPCDARERRRGARRPAGAKDVRPDIQ